MVRFISRYYLGDLTEGDEMAGHVTRKGQNRNAYWSLVEHFKEKVTLKNVCLDGRIIFNRI